MMKNIIFNLGLAVSVALVAAGRSFAATAEHFAEEIPEHIDTLHDVAHGAAHSGGGLPQLDPTWFPSQIFWLVIMFVALYTIFSKKVLPELSKTLESRHEHIQGNLDEAEKLKKDAEKVHNAYEKILEEARTKASELFSKVENDVKLELANTFSDFRERSAKKVEASEKYIAAATKTALKDMDQIAAELASQAAEKIVGIRMDISQAKSVIDNINQKAA